MFMILPSPNSISYILSPAYTGVGFFFPFFFFLLFVESECDSFVILSCVHGASVGTHDIPKVNIVDCLVPTTSWKEKRSAV